MLNVNLGLLRFLIVLLSLDLSLVSAEHIRAAFDVGSGQTKVNIAVIDEATGRATHSLFSEEKAILVGHDLKQSKDGRLSPGVLAELEDALIYYRNLALQLGAKEMAGVATAVFRESKNGAEFISKIRNDLGINLQVISQEKEGRIGFLSAAGASGKNGSNIIAWDSGGASFQITAEDGPGLVVYKGPWGASKVLAAMVEQVQGKDFKKIWTVNPATMEEVKALKLIIEKSLVLPPAELQRKLNDHSVEVVAIGGPFSPFRMAEIAIGKATYNKMEVWQAINELVGSTDEELALAQFPEPEMVIPRLTLIYTVMDHFGIDKVFYAPTVGSTPGIFITPEFWNVSQNSHDKIKHLQKQTW